MHFLITYGVANITQPQLTELLGKLDGILKPYPHYKALGSTYVVKAASPSDWKVIFDAFVSVGTALPSPIAFNFLITPLMAAGSSYNGMMPAQSWSLINPLTQ